MVVRYIRDLSDNPVAVLILDGDSLGWSACNWKQGDVFNKKTALMAAKHRLKFNDVELMPHYLKNLLPTFLDNPRNSTLLINEFNTRKKVAYKTPLEMIRNPSISYKVYSWVDYVLQEEK